VLASARYPRKLSASTAWLGIYQALLWHEPVNALGFTDLPHIIDADKLRATGRQVWTKTKPWQTRAQAVKEYLAKELAVSPDEVPALTDGLMKLPAYEGMQRQNSLGMAFAGLVKHLLEKFGSGTITYEIEVDAVRVFPGITFPGRSDAPRIDLLARCDGIPRAIISAKWSVRHDRLSDITNEGPVYKAAYQRIFRQERNSELLYYVVTNEYDPGRLTKMLDDTSVDNVVHVHKPAVVDVCGLNGRLSELVDLSDFIKGTRTWCPSKP